MTSEDDHPPAGLESDIYAERDVWAIRDSYNVYVNHTQSTDQVLAALENNRGQFEALREQYALATSEDGGFDKPASRKRKVYFKELNRLYSATEAIKDELRRRGASFVICVSDEEHPNAAYRRYLRKWEAERLAQMPPPSKCYVVTAIYGERSRELALARRVCRHRFLLNPWMLPSWAFYKLLGPSLARIAKRNRGFGHYMNLLVARPIVLASNASLSTALLWILYLGLLGWLPVLPFIYFAVL